MGGSKLGSGPLFWFEEEALSLWAWYLGGGDDGFWSCVHWKRTFEKCRAVPAMCTIPVITGCRDIPFFTPISLGEDDDDHRTLFLTMLCAFHALLPLPRRRYHTRTSTNLILCFTVNGLATVIIPYSCRNKLQTLDYGTAAQPFVHFTRTPHPNNAKSPKAYTHMHTAHPPTHPLLACMLLLHLTSITTTTSSSPPS